MSRQLVYIHPQAKIGKNVIVEPFTTITKNVKINEGTWIGSHVTIMEGAEIGKNCKIFPGAVISAEPQDLKYLGENTKTIIGNNTIIREFVTINKGTNALGYTKIGSYCLIMAYVHIAHDCVIGNNVIFANSVQLAGHVIVENFAFIGGTSAVHQFVKIGAHTIISGGTLIRKDIPPYVKAGRTPVSYLGINSIGLRRRNFNLEKIREIQKIYHVLFQKNNNITKALKIIKSNFIETPERDQIINFINSSSRGIMRGYNSNLLKNN